MEHSEWLKTLPGAPSITSAARTANIQKTTLIRQLDRGVIPPENVIALARAYKVSIVDALVDTGHIDEDEVKIIGVSKALGYATNGQILEEMLSRVDPQATRMFHGEDGEITPKFSNNVHSLRPHVAPLSDDEIADAIREANEMPQAAHTDDGIEYTEPDHP